MSPMTMVMRVAVLASTAAVMGCSPPPAAVDEKCPKFTVTSEVGKPAAGNVTFTLSPTRDGLTYNWSTSAGTIVSGQGTPTIIVEDPTPGDTVTVTADVGGLDASCPRETGSTSVAAQLP
jgi:hypothetical protein